MHWEKKKKVEKRVTFTLLLSLIINTTHTLSQTELHTPQCAEVGR